MGKYTRIDGYGISYAFSFFFGYNGIWWAWPISWFVTDLFLYGYYLIKANPELKEKFKN